MERRGGVRTFYANTQETVRVTVRPIAAAHMGNANQLAEVKSGYLRSYFFCPILEPLEGLALAIWEASKSLPGPEVPSKTLLATAFQARYGVSLEGLMRINGALGSIVSARPTSTLADTINRVVPGGHLPAASIVSSMHFISPVYLASLREELGFKDRVLFSNTLFNKGPLSGQRFTPYLVSYLEDGYSAKHERTPGDYKVTARFALEMYDRLTALATAKGVSLLPFHEVFVFGSSEGSRNGHSVKALPRSLGNLLDTEAS